ncbi:MAG: hypothetical protein AB1344_03865 [Pseudomonadota bacterium]
MWQGIEDGEIVAYARVYPDRMTVHGGMEDAKPYAVIRLPASAVRTLRGGGAWAGEASEPAEALCGRYISGGFVIEPGDVFLEDGASAPVTRARAATATAEGKPAEDGGKAWVARARELALEIQARDRAEGHATKRDYAAEEIAQRLLEEGYRGRGDKSFTAATVVRDALSGWWSENFNRDSPRPRETPLTNQSLTCK